MLIWRREANAAGYTEGMKERNVFAVFLLFAPLLGAQTPAANPQLQPAFMALVQIWCAKSKTTGPATT